MPLDTPTLVTVAAFITGLLGVFLLAAWLQDRSVRAMAWWGSAYLIGAAAVVLWAMERTTAFFMADVPNAMLFIACGMIWNGARLFHGRPVLPGALLAGAVAWLAACQFPLFVQWGNGRIILSSLIIASYTVLASMELRRERRQSLRWLAISAPIFHGTVFLSPIALTLLWPRETTVDGWFAVFALQTLLYVVGTAFVVMVMANQRMTAEYKTAAMTDTLTGLFNRRAFFSTAQELVAKQMRKRQPVSVLAFDLDRFKSVNDRFGHAVGDDTLRLFASTASASMRASDVIGRLGGEEFVAILPGSLDEAIVVAERVRAAFEQVGVEISGHRIGATVSIGVAESVAPLAEIGDLLARADAALYRAKNGGRNCVVTDRELPDAPPSTEVAAAA
jgi:diguanylate cyclase (GGDEF)-like protein